MNPNKSQGNIRNPLNPYVRPEQGDFHSHNGVDSLKLDPSVLPISEWSFLVSKQYFNTAASILLTDLPRHDYYKLIFQVENISADILQIQGRLNNVATTDYDFTYYGSAAVGSVLNETGFAIMDGTSNGNVFNQCIGEFIVSGVPSNGIKTFWGNITSNVGDAKLLSGALRNDATLLTSILVQANLPANFHIDVFFRDIVKVSKI